MTGKNQTKQMIYSFFRSKLEEVYQAVGHDIPLNPSFVTLQEINRKAEILHFIFFFEIQHTYIIIFFNTSPMMSQYQIMT